MKRIFFILAACFFIVSAVVVEAAEVPSRETAGAEEARFSDKDPLEDIEKASVEPPSILEEKSAKPETLPQGPRFLVKELRITGNYSIAEAELRPYVSSLLNREVTLAEIQEAVDAMKKHYRSKGFVAAYVYVPAQEIDEGVLSIDVLEGRLGEVKFSGNRWYSKELLGRMLRLKPYGVLQYEPLRRSLKRMNRRADLKAKAVLAAGELTGTTDVVVEVEEKVPYQVSFDANNYGTENTGEFRYGIAASHSNLFGNLEELSGNVQFGKSVEAWGAGYSFPVQQEWGTRLGYSFAAADVDVGGVFAALDVEGEARTHRVFVSQPVYESEGLDVDASLGLDLKRVENKLLGVVSGLDELSIPNADLSMKQSDAGGVTFFSNRFNWGAADFLGSSDEVNPGASRAGTGGEFFAYRGTLVRLQRLCGEVLLSLRGTLQLSPDALSPSEQLSVGGARSVRGYQEGEYLGDHGGFASVDVYFPADFFPEHWRLPFAKEDLRKQVQLVAFADAGTASLRRPLSGEKKDKDLAGAGVGVRIRLYEKFYGRFEYAFPLGDRPFDNRDNAFYFTVSHEIF